MGSRSEWRSLVRILRRRDEFIIEDMEILEHSAANVKHKSSPCRGVPSGQCVGHLYKNSLGRERSARYGIYFSAA
jgi:hypothetical protein